jgi:hypothetical protein
MGIIPKKLKSISEMREFCDECLHLHLPRDEKEVHLQLGKDD